MPNPSLIICDSDVLVQFFLCNELRPLRDLKTLYSIQPAIVQEVDAELRWLGHYGARFVPQLDKSLKNGLLVRLDKTQFQSLLGTAPAGTSWAGFRLSVPSTWDSLIRGKPILTLQALFWVCQLLATISGRFKFFNTRCRIYRAQSFARLTCSASRSKPVFFRLQIAKKSEVAF
jgi:hypothetical protein